MPDDLNDLKKQKAVTQAAFTRIGKSIERILETDCESTVLEKSLDELGEKYKLLESICDKIVIQSDEDPHITDLLSDKYDFLLHIRTIVSKRNNVVNSPTDGDGSSNVSLSSSTSDTMELIKSFQASLTLPKPEVKRFSGNSADFPQFNSYIETYVEPNITDPKQRLTLLIDSCTGIARESIAYLIQSTDSLKAYLTAKDTLKDMFGRSHKVTQSVLNECVVGSNIKPNDFEQLRKLVISMKKAQVTLQENGNVEELYATEKLVSIYRRLPTSIQHRWNDRLFELQEKKERPSIADLCKTIELYIHSRDNEYCTSFSVAMTDQTHVKKIKPIFTVTRSDNKPLECLMCKNSHYLNQCNAFVQLDLKSRYDFVSRNKLCRNCLHSGHIASRCKQRSLCKSCSGKHNNVLHDPYYKANVHSDSVTNQSNVASENVNQVLTVTQSNDNMIAGIACIDVIVEGKDCLIKCKGIVDQKSTVSLCSERLANQLNLETTLYDTTFNVATGNFQVKGKKMQDVKVYSNDLQNNVVIDKLLTVSHIPMSMGSVFTKDDLNECEHLKDVHVPVCTVNDRIDILIGSGTPQAFHQYEVRKGKGNEIYAVRMTLGWDLVGPKVANKSFETCSAESHSDNVLFLNDGPCSNVSDDLEKIFHQDFQDCTLFSCKNGLSLENEQALKQVENSILLENKEFTVGIPWKENPLNLPFNKEVVSKRMIGLKCKFERDSSLHEAYTNEMEGFIKSGYIERCFKKGKMSHFIPHHPVWHPKKRSLRIVWDCAMSLNDFINEGPDLLNPLVDVLIRFRRFQYAVTADIRKMYLNIKLSPDDRDALKLLWWPNGDTSKELVEYNAAVHIYGAKSSGFIANFCVKKLVDNLKESKCQDILSNDLYVDDLAFSVDDEESAISLGKEASEVLKGGSFLLTKYVSNSPIVMESLCQIGDVSCSESCQSKTEHSILGIKWSIADDELCIPCPSLQNEEIPTRRSILSLASKVFDPIGLVSPALLPLKLELQDKCKLDWNDTHPDFQEIHDDFGKTLKLISNLRVPRCYKQGSLICEQPNHISLHGFCDASSSGYSAVVYLRQVFTDDRVVVSLVLGKSRVAPKFKGKISLATIPKLELNAAALLAKITKKVKDCIDLNIQETVYWCDSQVVLDSLVAYEKRFPVYWTNRLAVIHTLSDAKEWRYVPSECNAADVGSRGVKFKEFNKGMDLWLNGPKFLLLSNDMWPERNKISSSHELFVVTEESQQSTEQKNDLVLSRIISHYSSLPRLIRMISKIVRFMTNVQSKMKGQTTKMSDVEIEEYSLIALIRFEQKSLVLNQLKKLKPFVDDKGLYRVHSRLSNANHLAYNKKCPVILAKHSILTKLIVQDEHERSAHMGVNHVLCNLRSKYWVVGGKNTVKRCVSLCRKCREEKAVPLQQIMCPLPQERCTPAFPFQNVGLDYFGPFSCKVRRQHLKRYGCIFVCLASRAVHIESVASLETSAFLCAFSRFMSRRGKPAKVYSDNASTFVGAQKELKLLVDSVNECMSDYSLKNGFEWHFHPPHGSHHAGHYERLIRSVRKVLRGLTKEQEMNEDVLSTFLCEAEKIVNDRPLTQVSDDPNDETPLTPNLILLLRGNSCKPIHNADNVPKQLHRQAQYMANIFWKRWLREYLPSLQARQKWCKEYRNLRVGDLVFLCDEGYPRGKWPIAKVVEVMLDSDNNVRKVIIRDKNGLKERPVSKLALLEALS